MRTQNIIYAFIFSIILAESAFAYRPFISTDASVADTNKLQVEFNAYTFTRQNKDTENITSGARFNYGIMKNWEFAIESDVLISKNSDGRAGALSAPAVTVTHILREGILQNKEGPSIGIAFDALFSSGIEGEKKTGTDAVGIFSYKYSDFVYHLNAGVELDRSGLGPNMTWGAITEYPFNSPFRIVCEFNGTVHKEGNPENFGLLGFIWTIDKIDFDFAARRGLSPAAPDWQLTTGMTFYF